MFLKILEHYIWYPWWITSKMKNYVRIGNSNIFIYVTVKRKFTSLVHKMLLKFLLFYTHRCFACICAPCTCLVPKEARRGHSVTWNRNCSWLWATLWVLRIETISSGRVLLLAYQPSLQSHKIHFKYVKK